MSDGVGGENDTLQAKLVLCGTGSGAGEEMKCLKLKGFFSLVFLIALSANVSASASVSWTGVGLDLIGSGGGGSGVNSFAGLFMNCLKENGFCSTLEEGDGDIESSLSKVSTSFEALVLVFLADIQNK